MLYISHGPNFIAFTGPNGTEVTHRYDLPVKPPPEFMKGANPATILYQGVEIDAYSAYLKAAEHQRDVFIEVEKRRTQLELDHENGKFDQQIILEMFKKKSVINLLSRLTCTIFFENRPAPLTLPGEDIVKYLLQIQPKNKWDVVTKDRIKTVHSRLHQFDDIQHILDKVHGLLVDFYHKNGTVTVQNSTGGHVEPLRIQKVEWSHTTILESLTSEKELERLRPEHTKPPQTFQEFYDSPEQLNAAKKDRRQHRYADDPYDGGDEEQIDKRESQIRQDQIPEYRLSTFQPPLKKEDWAQTILPNQGLEGEVIIRPLKEPRTTKVDPLKYISFDDSIDDLQF